LAVKLETVVLQTSDDLSIPEAGQTPHSAAHYQGVVEGIPGLLELHRTVTLSLRLE
jgi:hypothetical protein